MFTWGGGDFLEGLFDIFQVLQGIKNWFFLGGGGGELVVRLM